MPADDALTLFDDVEDLVEPAGHAERFATRWRLVGAGLSNVWRYGNLRLDAPSGRLLLRGPNGTGKTTALEALWPYLLDLNPQRLAAGKARPTTLALLMREGAGSAKRRCGYLWLTFAAPNDEGRYSYGARLLYSESGSPAVRVTPFMVPGVPLDGVPLYGSGGAFLSAEQFTDTVTGHGGTVFPHEDAYVAHLATRIWVANEQELTELANRIRAVRNPTLLGDVSPQRAADALRDALPGISDDVVSATAEALAESEATREAFQKDRDAAVALDRFAEAWAGHVVDVVTAAHATAKKAVADADTARKAQARVDRELRAAREADRQAMTHLETVKRRAGDLDAEIRALEESEPYKAAGRLTDLQERVKAEQNTASISIAAFRAAVESARDHAAALRNTAGEVSTDLDDLVTEAAGLDPRARPDHPLLRCGTRPRAAYLVGDVSIDPGPGTVLDVGIDQVGIVVDAWRGLAKEHRARASAALLALTDRTETNDAESEARDAAESARSARLRAEEGQRRLARETNATRAAVRKLVDAVDIWFTDHSVLAPVAEAVYRDEHPDAADDERMAWQRPDLSTLTDDEPAQAIAEIDRSANLVRTVGESAAAILRHRSHSARQEGVRLRAERDRLRAEAQVLRDGKLLPVPRPDWAEPVAEGAAFADAVEWHPSVTDPATRARIETALASSGLLGAALVPDGVRTDHWCVDASGSSHADSNLSTVLVIDAAHPHAATAREVLRRIPLCATSDEAAGGAGLVIGRDGTFAAGPLRGRPPGVDNEESLRPAEYVGAAQRRAAALARAAELDTQAAALDDEAHRQDGIATANGQNATKITDAIRSFPSRSAATRAEAARAAAAGEAATLQELAGTAAREAADLAETARGKRLEWERRTRSAGLPIDVKDLEHLRDDGARTAKHLDMLGAKLGTRLLTRLTRLAAAADDDSRDTAKLAGQHARTGAAVGRATKLAAEHEALVRAVGLDARDALAQHAAAKSEREILEGELVEAANRHDGTRGDVQRLELAWQHAEQRVTDADPPVAAAQRHLRTLIDVPGVADVVFEPATVPRTPSAEDDTIIPRIGHALSGKRTVGRRLLRERYDTCRAELAGLWTLDPGDTYEGLDTFILTHDGVAYTPPASAEAGRRLRDRAQQALNKAEESALRDFVIGRLPLAIGTAWVSIEDWVKDVNRKMQKAAASSGVGVRISKALVKDLSAAELTVHRLTCKETTLTAAQQAEVGEALQDLIAAAAGATMTERLANAIDVRKWLDISYEIVRPDGKISRWTSKTGLSGGERRLVVLAPMLAAVAAYYDQLDLAGLRLAALDEVPAEVDERGREGLARYIAELDLDLICTSYLWDGAPGAWDGIDAWDLEAGPDTTVVAFPMLVRGLHPLPGDTAREAG